jgi:hypothetical protein
MNWDDVFTCALAGTERQPLVLDTARGASDDAVQAWLAQLDGSDAEGMLLTAAATLALARQVGKRPQSASTDPPSPCPPDEQPRCSPQAAAMLARVLQGEYPHVLPEWVRLAQQAGQRAPEEYLPALLDLGAREAEMRSVVLAVVGRRGCWLAAYNPKWQYAQEAVVFAAQELDDAQREARWQTGSPAVRLALLSHLRRTDATRGRELLASTWKTEKADDRRQFIAALEETLSMDDEPFLEAALDDRSKEVRLAVARCLSQLPGSRLSQRLRERATPLLTLKRGKKRHTLEVSLPEACDGAMQRDGITTDPPARLKMGQRAWWLCQMVARIPPAYWYTRWDIAADELVQAARRSDWWTMLLHAWMQAAHMFRDAALVEALLPYLLRQDAAEAMQVLVATLPVARVEDILLEQLQQSPQPFHSRSAVLELLKSYPHPWGARLTRAVLDALRRRSGEAAPYGKGVSSFGLGNLSSFAGMMDPALAQEATQGWPRETPHWAAWEGAVEDMLGLLLFRQEMRRCF